MGEAKRRAAEIAAIKEQQPAKLRVLFFQEGIENLRMHSWSVPTTNPNYIEFLTEHLNNYRLNQLNVADATISEQIFAVLYVKTKDVDSASFRRLTTEALMLSYGLEHFKQSRNIVIVQDSEALYIAEASDTEFDSMENVVNQDKQYSTMSTNAAINAIVQMLKQETNNALHTSTASVLH